MEKTTQDRTNIYPKSWWMPGKGTEFGLVSRPKDGDLLTPLYPALGKHTTITYCQIFCIRKNFLESAYRITEESHPALPKIPVQSIGYEEVEVLLRHLSPENPAPAKWVGKLNAPYRLGPNLLNPGWKVVLNVSMVNERRTIYNTIGILRGSLEDGKHTKTIFGLMSNMLFQQIVT